MDDEVGAVQDRSFARASAATAAAYPPERRLTAAQLARYPDRRSCAVLIEGPAEALPPEEAPADFRARPGDWARAWLRLRAEKILSYAEPGVPLD